jgi:hypothetical protein
MGTAVTAVEVQINVKLPSPSATEVSLQKLLNLMRNMYTGPFASPCSLIDDR